MIATGFIPLLMVCIEVVWQFGAAVVVEHATIHAARTGALGRRSGSVPLGPACIADVKAAAVNASGGFLVPNRLTVTARSYATFSALDGDRSENGGTVGTGTSGSFVLYRLNYDQPLLFFRGYSGFGAQMFGGSANTNGVIAHVARSIIKNEPYPNAASAASC